MTDATPAAPLVLDAVALTFPPPPDRSISFAA